MVVGALLHAPSARGLFNRAVMMSGSSQNILSSEDADAVGALLASRISNVWTATTSEVLGAAAEMVPLHGMMPFQPCIDGDFLVDHACASGLDILLGVTENEALCFVPQLSFGGPKSIDEASDIFEEVLSHGQMDCGATQADRDEIIASVKASYDVEKSKDVFRRLLSLVVFESPFLASALEFKASNNLYVYRNMVGAGHAGELGFVFGTWNSNVASQLIGGLSVWNKQENARIGQAMESLWGKVLNSFVRTGTPADDWPLFDERSLAMSLGPEGLVEIPATAKATEQMCDLLRRRRRPWGLKFPEPTSKL
jgi:carboxylesterase type B